MVKQSHLGVVGCSLNASGLGPIFTLNPSNPSEGSRRTSCILLIRKFEAMLSVMPRISSKRYRRRFMGKAGRTAWSYHWGSRCCLNNILVNDLKDS
jgi:hypothetical protein